MGYCNTATAFIGVVLDCKKTPEEEAEYLDLTESAAFTEMLGRLPERVGLASLSDNKVVVYVQQAQAERWGATNCEYTEYHESVKLETARVGIDAFLRSMGHDPSDHPLTMVSHLRTG